MHELQGTAQRVIILIADNGHGRSNTADLRACVAPQGVVTVTDLSSDQVDAMAGGPTLRSQALAFGIVRNVKALQKGMARLLEALQQVRPPPLPGSCSMRLAVIRRTGQSHCTRCASTSVEGTLCETCVGVAFASISVLWGQGFSTCLQRAAL